MTILKNLLNTGIPPIDAQILEDAYGNEPNFVAGLEQTARRIAGQGSGGSAPAGAPWAEIWSGMPDDTETSFNAALDPFPSNLQMALAQAIGTRLAQINDWDKKHPEERRKKKTIEYLESLAALGYDFKFNECTNNVECNGVSLNDLVAAQIRAQMRDRGYTERLALEDAYTMHAWQNKYNPLRDYFASLKFRGGDPIGDLCAYFHDEHGIFPIVFRRWLVGSVARIYQETQNRMMVLDGRQNLGKDYFAKWLASGMPEYYYEGAIMPDEKDHKLKLLGTWIWNASEVGSTTRRSDREALKSFLTLQTVQERKPYGRYETAGRAITSFIGTINSEGGFLSDPTGHRRFATVHLLDIDWSYARLEVDQIWAQAYDLYLNNEPWNLTLEERRMIDGVNDQYQIVDMVRETMLTYYDVDPTREDWWLSTVDIMNTLKDPMIGNLKGEVDTRRLSAALTSLGLTKAITKADGSRQRGYKGLKRKGP